MIALKSQYAVIDHGRELFRGVAYEEYAADDMSEVPVEDRHINHLSRKQQADLLSVLKKCHVLPKSG